MSAILRSRSGTAPISLPEIPESMYAPQGVSFQPKPIASDNVEMCEVDDYHRWFDKKGRTMTKVYYSTVLEQTADQIWAVIRDFNSYPVWVESVTESYIEDGRSGDAVGCIRNFVEYGTRIRQRLLSHSDLDRFYTYESCEPLAPITYYQGTGRVTPIVEGKRAFVEWSVTFECPAEEQENCTRLLEEAMPRWLKSLRALLDKMNVHARARQSRDRRYPSLIGRTVFQSIGEARTLASEQQ